MAVKPTRVAAEAGSGMAVTKAKSSKRVNPVGVFITTLTILFPPTAL